jgi:hypothetical protein
MSQRYKNYLRGLKMASSQSSKTKEVGQALGFESLINILLCFAGNMPERLDDLISISPL